MARAGGRITLIYLWLPSAEHSLRRVAQRVRSGGHGIPEETIRRRYLAGLRNTVELYLPLADSAFLYDNEEGMLQPIVIKEAGERLKIADGEKWMKILEVLHAEGKD